MLVKFSLSIFILSTLLFSHTKFSNAVTYKLTKDVIIRDKPNGKIVDVWNKGTKFTSIYEKKGWIEVSGWFPNKQGWKRYNNRAWIDENKVEIVQVSPNVRRNGIDRYIVIDKSNFKLKVIERKNGNKKKIYETTVATGLDTCLPKKQGGKCYYTKTGTYKIRWKIYKNDGIEWCIPKSMEKEEKYRQDIKDGKRCFKGALGKYALNIGKTYAIHGTKNLESLGKKASHGCIRAKNSDVKKIYHLMLEGDPVYIID